MNKDKTGDRLVASIRKSKTGGVVNKSAAPATMDEPSTTKPATKTIPTAATASDAKKHHPDSTRSHDNYSVGRRVWPD